MTKLFQYLNVEGKHSYLRLDQILGFTSGHDKKTGARTRIIVLGVNPAAFHFDSIEGTDDLVTRYKKMQEITMA